MTTQYTPILQLALPVTGELNGTWGDVVNDSITSMVEQAIAGAAVINTWSGASHTLTTADGSSDEARCAILICQGTPGASAQVICPNRTKLYVITNNVDGGYSVTIKTAAGTGVTVSNADSRLVYCNGTNVVPVTIDAGVTTFSAGTTGLTPSTGTSGDVTLSGTLAVANGGSGTTTATGTAGSIVLSLGPTLTSIKEVSSAVSASNIDLSLGNYFSKTISGSTTFTVSNVPTTGTAFSFILDLTNAGSSVTWWSGVDWANGVAPTLTTSGRDSLGFYTYDGGTTWSGFVLGKDMK